MRKQWLAGAALVLSFAFGAVAGTELLNEARANQQVAVDGGWRFADGYWNYWDPGDKAWYHTDGRHWYTYGDDAWTVYNFNKNFGKAYVREGYVVPRPGPDVVIPSHRIKVKVK